MTRTPQMCCAWNRRVGFALAAIGILLMAGGIILICMARVDLGATDGIIMAVILIGIGCMVVGLGLTLWGFSMSEVCR